MQEVRGWAVADSGAAHAAEQRTAQQGGVMGAGVNLFGVDNELGMSGGVGRAVRKCVCI